FVVLSPERFLEFRYRGFQLAFCVGKAIDEVVGILAFVSVVEREGLEAREGNDIGKWNCLSGSTGLTQQVSRYVHLVVKIEDERSMRNVYRRNISFGR